MQNPFQKSDLQPVQRDDHMWGYPKANVKLVIYNDFADPNTITIHEEIKNMMASFAEDVLVVYRHFPQVAEHPQSYAASQALVAAAKQGYFWAMVDQILAHQDQLSDGQLRQHAQAIYLDMAKFEDAFSSKATTNRIMRDMNSGKVANVQRVPALFINGTLHEVPDISMRFIQELIGADGDSNG